MSRKCGYEALNFQLITADKFNAYVAAVQHAADKDYRRMEELIATIFPG